MVVRVHVILVTRLKVAPNMTDQINLNENLTVALRLLMTGCFLLGGSAMFGTTFDLVTRNVRLP